MEALVGATAATRTAQLNVAGCAESLSVKVVPGRAHASWGAATVWWTGSLARSATRHPSAAVGVGESQNAAVAAAQTVSRVVRATTARRRRPGAATMVEASARAASASKAAFVLRLEWRSIPPFAQSGTIYPASFVACDPMADASSNCSHLKTVRSIGCPTERPACTRRLSAGCAVKAPVSPCVMVHVLHHRLHSCRRHRHQRSHFPHQTCLSPSRWSYRRRIHRRSRCQSHHRRCHNHHRR